MVIRLQREPFETEAELLAHRPYRKDIGAEVHFLGTMRDLNGGEGIAVMELEHYPGMTERELEKIVQRASSRWRILETLLVHRFGELRPRDPIVLVAVWSEYRDEAFDACRHIMDGLKTRAPFWKKERLVDGRVRWVEPGLGEGHPLAEPL